MRLLERTATLSPEQYQDEVTKGLDRAFRKARPEEVEVSNLKAVVFSDLHRGARDRADDFERCERAYAAALGWYLEQGFELWLLGDVEDLWENGIEEVMPKYRALLALEKEFALGPGLRRFYGNHDLDWHKRKRVREHLGDWLPKAEVKEALRLRVLDDRERLGLLFLVHGHQGTSLSDRLGWLSRLGLRYGWRAIQRAQGWFATTPAQDHVLRHKHDIAMHEWARQRVLEGRKDERPVLIAGHTHHPVFPENPPERPTPADATKLHERLERERDERERARLRAELELVRALLREPPFVLPVIDPPCYFNTGCCCFPDSDVTCLEISGEQLHDPELKDEQDGRGKIRLMRWLDDERKPRPKELAALSLRDVLERVAAAV